MDVHAAVAVGTVFCVWTFDFAFKDADLSACSGDFKPAFRVAERLNFVWYFDKIVHGDFCLFCFVAKTIIQAFIPILFNHTKKVIEPNIKTYGAEREQQELEDFFPRLSEKGSGDDVSLAGVFVNNQKTN